MTNVLMNASQRRKRETHDSSILFKQASYPINLQHSAFDENLRNMMRSRKHMT